MRMLVYGVYLYGVDQGTFDRLSWVRDSECNAFFPFGTLVVSGLWMLVDICTPLALLHRTGLQFVFDSPVEYYCTL